MEILMHGLVHAVRLPARHRQPASAPDQGARRRRWQRC